MKRAQLALGVGSLIILGGAVFLACEGVSVGPDGRLKTSECEVIPGAGFPMNDPGTAFHITTPAECPFRIAIWTYVDYAATGDFHTGATLRQYELTMTDNAGTTRNIFTNAPWSDKPATGQEEIQVTGTYPAAIGGFNLDDHGFYKDGRDVAHNRILMLGGNWVEVTGLLTYVYGQPGIDVDGTSTVGANSPYSLTARIHDISYVPPVHYDWYLDDVLTTQHSAKYSGRSGAEDTFQTLEAHTIDSNGVEHVDVHDVTVCPDGQRTC